MILLRHRPSVTVAATFLALTIAPAALRSQPATVVTPDLILSLAFVTDAQLSPDGTTVVYQLSRARSAAEAPGAARAEIWVVPAAGGAPRRLTQGDDRSPRWSPDGRRLAFLGRRPDTAPVQIHLLDMSGGESRPITTAPSPVTSFKWSPDGRSIAYTYVDPLTDQERRAVAEGRDWTVADRNYKHTRLHRIDLETGQSGVVTRADMTVHDYDWSPDSQQFVIGAAATPTIDDSFMGVRLYVVPAAGGTPEPFVPTSGKLGFPRWSPDGRTIAWLGATSLDDPYTGSIFTSPVGRVRTDPDRANLTGAEETTATWLGFRPGASDTLAVLAAERQDVRLHLINATTRAKQTLPAAGLVPIGTPSFSADGSKVALVAHAPTHPPEVFVGDTTGGMRRVTTTNPQLGGVALGAQEVVTWKARDGWTIEGVLVKPVGYRAGTRYPLVVQPHGGPEAADPNGWNGTYSRWGQMLAGAGVLTFYPNYRGSIGRGAAFAKADHQDLMGREFEDILDGIDHLVAAGVADPDRVGIGGGSYGGYASAWATTYASDRFKAAIPWMGITNWISMTGTSDIFLENSTVHWALVMYEHYDRYWERSPLRHIARAKTPTLIVHGAADPRVPPGQSLELYTALKWKGVPVEYVSYPREGHGLAERAHQEDFMTRVLAFFQTYLK
jgi:dipeptidyl aminopeptidase/acylaminoacyl peptidase